MEDFVFDLDKNLVLKIFTFCCYKDVYRWRSVNKFFREKLEDTNGNFFWQCWKKNRSALLKAELYLKTSEEKEIEVCGDKEDVYQIMAKHLYSNMKSLKLTKIYWMEEFDDVVVGKEEKIYESGSYTFEKECKMVEDTHRMTELLYPGIDLRLPYPESDLFFSVCHKNYCWIFKDALTYPD